MHFYLAMAQTKNFLDKTQRCISYSSWMRAMKVAGFSVKACSCACKNGKSELDICTEWKPAHPDIKSAVERGIRKHTLMFVSNVAWSHVGSGLNDINASAVLTWDQSTPPMRCSWTCLFACISIGCMNTKGDQTQTYRYVGEILRVDPGQDLMPDCVT